MPVDLVQSWGLSVILPSLCCQGRGKFSLTLHYCLLAMRAVLALLKIAEHSAVPLQRGVSTTPPSLK